MKTATFIFLAIGTAFIFIQNTFYGYVDVDGVLRDSLFLPLGTLATIVGLTLLTITIARTGINKLRSN